MPVYKANDNSSNNNISNYNLIVDHLAYKMIKAFNNNINSKLIKKRKIDTFLDEVYKKRVSNEIRQKNRKRNYCINYLLRTYLIPLRPFL